MPNGIEPYISSQTSRFADHPDIAAKVKVQSWVNEEISTKAAVLNAISNESEVDSINVPFHLIGKTSRRVTVPNFVEPNGIVYRRTD